MAKKTPSSSAAAATKKKKSSAASVAASNNCTAKLERKTNAELTALVEKKRAKTELRKIMAKRPYKTAQKADLCLALRRRQRTITAMRVAGVLGGVAAAAGLVGGGVAAVKEDRRRKRVAAEAEAAESQRLCDEYLNTLNELIDDIEKVTKEKNALGRQQKSSQRALQSLTNSKNTIMRNIARLATEYNENIDKTIDTYFDNVAKGIKNASEISLSATKKIKDEYEQAERESDEKTTSIDIQMSAITKNLESIKKKLAEKESTLDRLTSRYDALAAKRVIAGCGSKSLLLGAV